MTSVQAAAPRANLDVGKVLGLMFAAIGRNWRPIFLLVTPIVVVPAVANAVLFPQFFFAGAVAPAQLAGLLSSIAPLFLIALPIGLALEAVLISSVGWIIWADQSGQRPEAVAALRVVANQLGWVILAEFLRWVLATLGLMLLIVPGVMVWIAFCLTLPACVIEKRNTLDAMSRSRDLTRGNRGQLFLVFVVVVVLGIIPAVIASAIGTLVVVMVPGTVAAVVRLSLNTLASGFYSVLLASAIGCAYVELRTLKEGLGAVNVAQVFA